MPFRIICTASAAITTANSARSGADRVRASTRVPRVEDLRLVTGAGKCEHFRDTSALFARLEKLLAA